MKEKENLKYIVYRHISPSGKVYIGITSKKTKERWKHGNGYKRCPIFNKAIIKYGWDNFIHEVLLEDRCESEAKYAEKYLIKWYKIHKISYNISDGGGGACPRTEETKEKIRKANTGKPVSAETRLKHSLALKGRKKPEGYWERFKEIRKGYKHSSETKEKIRKTLQLKSPKNKSVLQYSLTGEFIREYISIGEASRVLDIDPSAISKVCRGKLNKCNNFIWKYKQ